MNNTLNISALAALAICAGLQAKGQNGMSDYNVVFIISDQHKTDVTGCYGDPVVQTPNIDALARSGVKFTRIYTPSPLSAPARAALMTGTYPSTNGSLTHQITVVNKAGKEVLVGAGNRRDGYAEEMTTWGEWMKANGLATGAIGKMHVHGELQVGVNPDYPEGNLMGFDVSDLRFYTSFPGGHYNNWKNNPDHNARYREIQEYAEYRKGNNFNQKLLPTLVKEEVDIFDYAVAALSSDFMESCVSKGQTFFLHAGLEKPHKPWSTVQRLYDLYTLDQMAIPATQRDWHDNGQYPYVRKGTHNPLTDHDEIRRSMLAYYACVTEMDEAVGMIVEKTRELGIYDKTIFVYTTDHGEHLYEHGLHEKHNMFEASVNIPFIISCPALLPQGITCDSHGSMIDVLPTIAELLGMAADPQWEGRSLLPQINSGEVWDRVVFSEFYQDNFTPFPNKNVPLRMRLDGEGKYIYTHGMIDQYYHTHDGDRDEMNNLALDAAYADKVERCRFLTVAGWKMPYAKPFRAKASVSGSGVTLKWSAVDQAEGYTVWASDDPDPATACKIGVTDNTAYKAARTDGKYYWITANWNLTRKGQRKENVPMITASLPANLPVSEMLTVR